MTSDTILICGGAGYIGSALTSRILKETNYNVKVFDQLLYGGDSLYPFFNYLDRFKFIQGDLRTFDLGGLLDNVDYVVNLAALVGEPICKKFPKYRSGSQMLRSYCRHNAQRIYLPVNSRKN